MKKRRGKRRRVWQWRRLAVLAFFVLVSAQTDRSVAQDIVFEKQIAPILEARCWKCHGPQKSEASLDLRRRFSILKGGEHGPAIVPGKPDESLLVQRIDKGEMPPAEEGRLDERQRELIRRWVAAGAPLATNQEPPLEESDSVRRISTEDRGFWSFRPPARLEVPQTRGLDRVRTPIDAFLLEKLEAKSLSFNPDAPKQVLIRRLCFDLIGLPPTPEQIAEFLSDEGTDSYERLVDRLLASPQYGERWARHWLDVAGYADSDGYLAADRLRPQAWRYRDYVIQSLNADMPYDRFLVEQLAGDELSDWRRTDELSTDMMRQLTATGFLRTALDPTYPGYTEPNEIHQVLSDTVQIVSTSLMGLTIQCARCHSHKFDPISHRDYYSLQAIFLPALDPARWQPSEVRGIPMATEIELARIAEQNKRADERIAQLNASITELTARHRKKLVQEKLVDAGKSVDAALLEEIVAAVAIPADKRNDEQKKLIADQVADCEASDADLKSKYPQYADDLSKLNQAVAAEKALKKSPVLLRGLSDLDDKPPAGHILHRGDYTKPGATVEPNVPEVLAPANFAFQPVAGYKTSGRRLAFARWLVDPSNPVTARVHVNRLWAHHFGRGLVSTRANFGRSGTAPTHPELLDWLATELMRSGWSQKAMHRLMVTSTAYRQTSDAAPDKLAVDPDNSLYGAWQTRRLDGESLRDSVLAVSGKLNAQLFGEPSAVVAQPDGSVTTNDDAAGNRRSVYLQVRRSQHVTLLDLFDTPMMEINCPERSASIVPLQALALLHGPFTERSAQSLAGRILAERPEPSDDADRIAFAYQLLFARGPSPREVHVIREVLAALVHEQLGADPSAATDMVRQAATRSAWTQISLVLLNSNEFVFVH